MMDTLRLDPCRKLKSSVGYKYTAVLARPARLLKELETHNPVKKNKAKSETDWKRVREMRDEDMDFSEIPPVTKEYWENAFVRKGMKPHPTLSQDMMPVDRDIIDYFKSKFWNYPAEMNRVLRAHEFGD